MSLRLSRKTATCKKTPSKKPLLTNEHLRPAAHRYTRKRIQTLHGNEACQTPTRVLSLPYVTYTPPVSPFLIARIFREEYIIKLLVMPPSSPVPCYLVPLKPQQLPQRHILQHPQPMVLDTRNHTSHSYQSTGWSLYTSIFRIKLEDKGEAETYCARNSELTSSRLSERSCKHENKTRVASRLLIFIQWYPAVFTKVSGPILHIIVCLHS
jgi:hypothetical protein